MANEQGRRAVVNDPLASGSTAVAGKGMGVQLQGIRNPGASGGNGLAQNMSALQESMAGLRQSVMAVAQEQTETAITDGKLKYMQGVTEEEITRTGDKATQQGWQALSVADKANTWFTEEALGIQNGNDRMDPAEYQQGLMKRRAEYLNNLPADPQVRAVYAAQFDDKAPRLVSAQMEAHNTYNKGQTENYFTRYISSSSSTNRDAPRIYAPGEVVPDKATKYYTMDPNAVRSMAIDEVKKQGLVGTVPVDGPKYGIKTGSAEEWANLITGLAAHESSLNNRTVGDTAQFAGGSQGLLQLSRHDAKTYGLNNGQDFTDEQLRDPTTNLSSGVAIIKSLVNKTGSIQKGMGQYWGPINREDWTPGNGRDRNLPWKEWQSSENGGIVPLPGVDDLPGRPGSPQVTGPDTDVKRFIMSSALPVDKKMTLVTNAILTQLDAGNSQLWESVGGSEFLAANGATQDQVRVANNAYDKFKKDRANKFNMDRASWEGELTRRLGAGAITLDDAKKEIQKKYDEGVLTDSGAYAMVQKAIAEDKKEGGPEDAVTDPLYMRKLSNTWEAIKADPYKYNAEWADAEIRRISQEHNVPEKQVQRTLGRAWSLEEQARDASIREAERVATEKAKEERSIADARAMYTTGSARNITGTIQGISAKQWAINDRANQLITVAQQSIPRMLEQNKGMTTNEAEQIATKNADRQLYSELQKQGVVRDEVANDVSGALSGSFVGSDGKVSDGAMLAFDVWKKLKDVDPTGAYGAKYMLNEDAHSTVLLAEKFYDGGLDAQSALRKAAQYMQDNKKSVEDAKTIPNYVSRVNKHIDESFSNLYGDGGILSKMFYSSSNISEKEREWAKNDYNMDKFKTAVKNNADVLFSADPTMDPDILTKKAVSAAINRSYIVGGNLIVAKSNQPEYDLKTQMFGKRADQFQYTDVNEAVHSYLAQAVQEGMPENPAFAREWKNREIGWFGKTWRTLLTAQGEQWLTGPGHQDTPPYLVQYDQRAGYISVQLYNDDTRASTVAPDVVQTLYIPVDRIGNDFVAKREKEAATAWDRNKGLIWSTDGGTLSLKRKPQ